MPRFWWSLRYQPSTLLLNSVLVFTNGLFYRGLSLLCSTYWAKVHFRRFWESIIHETVSRVYCVTLSTFLQVRLRCKHILLEIRKRRDESGSLSRIANVSKQTRRVAQLRASVVGQALNGSWNYLLLSKITHWLLRDIAADKSYEMCLRPFCVSQFLLATFVCWMALIDGYPQVQGIATNIDFKHVSFIAEQQLCVRSCNKQTNNREKAELSFRSVNTRNDG